MKILIRKAKLTDVKNLVYLSIELRHFHALLSGKNKTLIEFKKLKPNWKSIFKKWLIKNIKSKNSLVLVAEYWRELVGYSLFQIKDNVPIYSITKLGHVSDLYIKKIHREKGVASKFKKEAFKWFKRKGLKQLSIMVHSDNKKAHKIYRKWGFYDYHTELRKKV
ncbi:GNAT family N-acetyltransferase [Candidatus Micrarchaeota archaeon]|nr:GNAT family N-acetyltransferase [Candidatus Micrarchaeota archaeon]